MSFTKILLAALFAFAFAGCKKDAHDGHHHAAPAASPQAGAESAPVSASFDAPPAAGTVARCPVSGETFTVDEDTERSEHGGRHFAFCCEKCKPTFDEDPAKYSMK